MLSCKSIAEFSCSSSFPGSSHPDPFFILDAGFNFRQYMYTVKKEKSSSVLGSKMKEGIDEAKIKETNAKGLSLSFYYSDSLWNGHKKIQKKNS